MKAKIDSDSRWQNKRTKRIAVVSAHRRDRFDTRWLVDYRYESPVDNKAKLHRPHTAMQTVDQSKFEKNFRELNPEPTP